MDEEDHIASLPVGSWCFSSVSNHRAELFWLKGLHVRTRVRLRVVLDHALDQWFASPFSSDASGSLSPSLSEQL